MQDIGQKIEFHISPIVEQLGLELWGIDIIKSGKTIVCVYLEKAGIDECAQVSRLLGLVLEIEEIFPDAWVLEVSTPGMDRMFFNPQQLEEYIGQDFSVSFYAPCEDGILKGKKKIQGKLTKTEGNTFWLFVEDIQEEALIDWEKTKKVKCIPYFEENVKPITKTKKLKKEISE